METIMSVETRMNTINNPLWFSRYRDMKAKVQQRFSDNMYVDVATNVLLEMFEHDERIFRSELFEFFLHDTGSCALIRTDTAEYTPVLFNPIGGERYADGMLKDAVCYDLTGKEYNFKDWRNNPEILVFFNNNTMTQTTFIEKHATMLTNVDTSLNLNVFFSQMKPIPVARDSKTKNQIDQIMNDLGDGKLKTILADINIHDFIDGDNKIIDLINLTDVESSKYIQYLSNLHDNLISRLFFMMGLSISDNGKQAQISIEELNKSRSAGLAMCMPWYTARKRGFDEAEKKTGTKWDFDFSILWKSELEAQTMTPEEAEEKEPESEETENTEDGDNNENESED